MKNIQELVKKSIGIEADAISALVNRVDDTFEKAVDAIYRTKGKVIVTGVGKSGLIAKKIAATFSSTGTPSIFLHPTDAAHGDLGAIERSDLILALSKSGNTSELINIMPSIKRFGNTLIAIVGNMNSQLAKNAEIVLDGSVAKEACPLDLAPTASTTVALVIGDVLAAALIEKRGFSIEDFSLFHPSGTLGKKLLYRISDIMHKGKEIPVVNLNTDISSLIYEISSKGLGVTIVVDTKGKIAGIITDGDLRRITEHNINNLSSLTAKDILSGPPKTISKDKMAIKAANIMEKYKITSIVVSENNLPIGIIHMHDLLSAGII